MGGVLALLGFAALFLYVVRPMLWSNDTVVDFSDYNIRGIDISHYQPHIDWEQLQQARLNGFPIRFVIVKATEGVTVRDRLFHENYRQARNHGFVVGAYHFFRPDTNPHAQARFYLENIRLKSGDMPAILDVEVRGTKPLNEFRANVLQWLRLVEEATGAPPIIYSGVSFKNQYLQTKDFDRYPFWAAHYTGQSKPRYQGKWMLWQYSDQGRINGISGPVDLNLFNGKIDDFRCLLLP